MNLLRFILLVSLLAIGVLKAQVVTTIPENPGPDDEVTIIFDATQGNGALAGYEGEVYIHTGVITGTPENPSGWRFVQGEWGQPDPRMKTERIGPDKYQYRLNISRFYGLPEGEPFLQLAMVFRNADGTVVGKDEGDGDIFYPRIDKYPNGILETADGALARGLDTLRDIRSYRDGSVLLSDGQQVVVLRPYAENIINIRYYPKGERLDQRSEAVILAPEVNATRIDNPAGKPVQIYWNEEIRVEVDRYPMRLRMYKNGQLIAGDEKGFFYNNRQPGIDQLSGIRLQLKPDEKLYGGGSRAIPNNRRGYRFYCYNKPNYGYTWGETEVYLSIPFILSSEGYGVLFDNYRRGYLDLGMRDSTVLEFGAKDTVLSCYFILGDTPAQIMESYTQLTGRQPLPPQWAMGYLQSRFGYRTQEETLEIVRKTQEADIPLDGLAIDLYWFGDRERMGDLEWAKDQWPDPEGMLDSLDRRGVETVLITETYVVENTDHWDELVQNDFLARDENDSVYVIPDFWAGPAGLMDIFQPALWDWFWPFYQRQVEKGVGAWWCDSGEPENHPLDMYHSKGMTEDIHNIYALYWARMLAEKYQAVYPSTRLFNLMRSGYAGMQRYNTFPWSGDVSRSWGAYRAQIPIMLGAGLSGIGYMHSDLGGFTGGPADAELYLRWIQLGIFTPIMRVHGDGEGIEPEPVYWDETTLNLVREAVKKRQLLLPYNYTLAWENATAGAPLARPMFYHFPDDPRLGSLDDQFMWGAELLVAPDMESGDNDRKVVLPAGDWYDFDTGKLFEGGASHTLDLPLDRIPTFVRGGAILPTNPLPGNTRSYTGQKLRWLYYPTLNRTESSGLCFFDGGSDAQSLSNGSYSLTRLDAEAENSEITVRLSEENPSGRPGIIPDHQLELVINNLKRKPKKVRLGNKKLRENRDYFWKPASGQLLVMLNWNGEPSLLVLKGKNMLAE